MAISLYPTITILPKRKRLSFDTPSIPESIVQEHLESTLPDTIVTEATPPDRMVMVVSVAQNEIIHKYYGAHEKQDVWKLLEKVEDMPYTLILHGKEDPAVPVDGSIKWIGAVKMKFGNGKAKLRAGERA